MKLFVFPGIKLFLYTHDFKIVVCFEWKMLYNVIIINFKNFKGFRLKFMSYIFCRLLNKQQKRTRNSLRRQKGLPRPP